jgi:hypothetical protein
MHEYILRNWRLVKVATTKAQRKLFFNLRSMKATTAALSVAEAKAIAKDLGVKPEEVVEMETRLTGRDVSIDPTPGDEENSVSPIAYLTDSDDEPGKILERKQNAQNRTKGLNTALAKLDDRSRRIIEARWLREDDSDVDIAGTGRRVWRVRRADPPDRKQGNEDDPRADGARHVTTRHCCQPTRRRPRAGVFFCARDDKFDWGRSRAQATGKFCRGGS